MQVVELTKPEYIVLKRIDYERANPCDVTKCVLCQSFMRIDGGTAKVTRSGRVEWTRKNEVGEWERVRGQLSAIDMRHIAAFDVSRGKLTGADGYRVEIKPPFPSSKPGYRRKSPRVVSKKTIALRNKTRATRTAAGVR